ncbi:MAG: fructosamine kinase family protein [Motilibacteraceae bacterium]
MLPRAAELVAKALQVRATGCEPVAGGDVARAWRVTLADGRAVFAKTLPGAPPTLFPTEAAGLRRLQEAPEGVPVPAVLAADADVLVLEWIPAGAPDVAAAEALGRRLAATHGSLPPGTPFGNLGAAPGGVGLRGYLGPLPLPAGTGTRWGPWWVEHRVAPYARLARERGNLSAGDAADVDAVCERIDELAGPAEPTALLHGDLWSGNVLWGADGVARLIDPACHAGHRETDLAMLALFGCPHLDRVLAAYAEATADRGTPLAEGWQRRVPLHQLVPLLVHAVLFGGGYGARAGQAAREALRAA